ncbi:hypothetical protein scyTo_0002376 [Scyliorhinus torazame]|uniref:Uncharacterized protein n=1 Tax=Scyliorhinus torazame TaxID=75743 RepID=A0A401PJ45_SCYTO|nr:hypothetical protein [Scyliorhinus torazame]
MTLGEHWAPVASQQKKGKRKIPATSVAMAFAPSSPRPLCGVELAVAALYYIIAESGRGWQLELQGERERACCHTVPRVVQSHRAAPPSAAVIAETSGTPGGISVVGK